MAVRRGCILPQFNKKDVDKIIAEELVRVERIIIRNLQYVGENALAVARNSGDYTDQTGNLRSSIGYIVAKNGKIIKRGGFNPNQNSGTEGQEGASDGENFAIETLKDFSTGYVLIVVAGMKYAEYVEKKDYDVLTFTEAESKALARELFKKIAA
jgi:hypothetical protein